MRSLRPAVPRRRRRRTLTPPSVTPRANALAAMRDGVMPAGTGGSPGLPMAGGMPSMKKGGTVKKTGPHKLHKGEKVVPAKKAKDMGAAMKHGSFPPRKKR